MLAIYQRIMYQLFKANVRRGMMMRNKVCADVMKLRRRVSREANIAL